MNRVGWRQRPGNEEPFSLKATGIPPTSIHLFLPCTVPSARDWRAQPAFREFIVE